MHAFFLFRKTPTLRKTFAVTPFSITPKTTRFISTPPRNTSPIMSTPPRNTNPPRNGADAAGEENTLSQSLISSPTLLKSLHNGNDGVETADTLSLSGDSVEHHQVFGTDFTGYIQTGTRKNPFLSPTNLLSNEELARDFNGAWLDLKRKGWRRPAVLIRKLIVPYDEKLWQAFIPNDNEFPEFSGRSVFVQGPSMDFMMKHPDLYHKLKNNHDVDIYEHHNGYILTKGNLIPFVWYLVVFPTWVLLDNTHFAGSATKSVPKTKHGILLKEDNKNNSIGKDMRFMYLHWEVASKFGGQKLSGDSDSDGDDFA